MKKLQNIFLAAACTLGLAAVFASTLSGSFLTLPAQPSATVTDDAVQEAGDVQSEFDGAEIENASKSPFVPS